MRRHALHPATLVSTWFWVGRIPRAPGTFGSLAALPLAWLIQFFLGPAILAAAILAVFAAGCWAAHHYVRNFDEGDPGEVVVDEVAGQWIACLLLPPDMLWMYLAAFVVFRMLDIFKPWPISYLDRNIAGGLGIMADDILAGIIAMLLLQAFLLFFGGPWTPMP
jgi:phosphatidylglycerophosphatase A